MEYRVKLIQVFLFVLVNSSLFANGNICRLDSIVSASGDYRVLYEYENGKIKKSCFFYSGGNTRCEEYLYDESGLNVTLKHDYFYKDFYYKFDESGRLIQSTDINSVTRYSYDKYSNLLLKESTVFRDGDPLWKNKYVYFYEDSICFASQYHIYDGESSYEGMEVGWYMSSLDVYKRRPKSGYESHIRYVYDNEKREKVCYYRHDLVPTADPLVYEELIYSWEFETWKNVGKNILTFDESKKNVVKFEKYDFNGELVETILLEYSDCAKSDLLWCNYEFTYILSDYYRSVNCVSRYAVIVDGRIIDVYNLFYS